MVGSHFGRPVIASQEKAGKELKSSLSTWNLFRKVPCSTDKKLLLPLGSVISGFFLQMLACVSASWNNGLLDSETPGAFKVDAMNCTGVNGH